MATRQDSHTAQILKTLLVSALVLTLFMDGVNAEKIRLMVNNDLSKPSSHISAINGRSLSPWKSITTIDSNRIPKYISEARCLKQGCVWPNGTEDWGLESVPIQIEVLVLKRSSKVRGQRKGRRRSRTGLYEPSYQVITAGCTCVRPKVVRYD
ncbi:interleukin-17F-like [Sardina pilchardus]|uniref:interleukin-17F-like n=1 Tax=Sardina pilchardus TaxID=27697 RepID=UPI002E10CE7A